MLDRERGGWALYTTNLNCKTTSTGNHLETCRKSEILDYWLSGLFRLKYLEEILLKPEFFPIELECGEHQSLVFGKLQDINFDISLGFPKTWPRFVGDLSHSRRYRAGFQLENSSLICSITWWNGASFLENFKADVIFFLRSTKIKWRRKYTICRSMEVKVQTDSFCAIFFKRGFNVQLLWLKRFIK